MALLIKKTDLKRTDGSTIEIGEGNDDGLLVRFFPQGEFKGFNQKLFLSYYTKLQFDADGFGTTQPMYNDGENYQQLITNFTEELSIPEIMQVEVIARQVLGQDAPCFMVTAFAYHYFIKNKLEEFLGEGTVIIRLDLM
jgi:hypothetical protein